jgi:hypothetical protein
MFVVISHHHCKPGQVELARERMDRNAAAMPAEPGFLYRYRLETPARPSVISAFTVWAGEADYDRYRGKRFGGGHDLAATPYEKVEVETYAVGAVAGTAPG